MMNWKGFVRKPPLSRRGITRYLPGLRKTIKNTGHNVLDPSRDSNQSPLECVQSVAARIVCPNYSCVSRRTCEVLTTFRKLLSWNKTQVISHNLTRLVVSEFKVNSVLHTHLYTYISLLKHNLELKWTGEVSTPEHLD
jgi:hypothetical protein